MKKRTQKKLMSFVTVAVIAAAGYLIEGKDFFNHLGGDTADKITNITVDDHKQQDGTVPYSKDTYDRLAALDFTSGEAPIVYVNDNKSTVDISGWQTNKVVYGGLDALNRTTYATAYIDKQNLGKSEGRDSQTWRPTGWHQKTVSGEAIYNRGHLLAYTSSFNFDTDGNYKKGEDGSIDNPKNLATQSAYSNQRVQTRYEALVRKAQAISGNKVLYQIVTVFRSDELMPRGYWLQAKDSKNTLDFNVYLFNVQPQVLFDYQTGSSKIDRSLTVGKLEEE